MHFQGEHPFKHLRCRAYEHTFCDRCLSSEIIGLASAGSSCHAPYEQRFFQICPKCGLTHRLANEQGVVAPEFICPCGTTVQPTCLPFTIGCPQPYRSDPLSCAVHLKIDRAICAVEREHTRRDMPSKDHKPTSHIRTLPLSEEKEWDTIRAALPPRLCDLKRQKVFYGRNGRYVAPLPSQAWV